MVEHISSLFGRALKPSFTGQNNFKIRTASDIEFAEYFGFTAHEVKEMLKYYSLDKFYGDIKEWYDGYLIETGKTESGISRLIILNKEIQEIYRDKIQSWYWVKVKEDQQKWRLFCDAVKKGDAETFQKLFDSYMSRTISIRDEQIF